MLELEWVAPTQFAVNVVVTLFPSTPAVDAILIFKNNNATHHSELITNACTIDTTWVLPSDAVLKSALGSNSGATDFTHTNVPFTSALEQHFRPGDYWDGTTASGQNRYAGAGRSSNGQMPFFHVESEQLGAGVTVGLGWSGQWNANFTGTSMDDYASKEESGSGVSIRAVASLEGARFVVLPQEELRTLRVLVSSYNRSELSAALVVGSGIIEASAVPPSSPSSPGNSPPTQTGYFDEALPLHSVGLVVLRRIILAHYAARTSDASRELIYPKIAALGYPGNVSDGHGYVRNRSKLLSQCSAS